MGFEKKKGFFLDDSNAKHTAAKILEDFVPGFDYSRKVSELSPSEMQIVEVAKAISQEPKMLILDEPTAALEQSQVEILFKYMRMLADRGVGMVFTSHRMWEVMDICDDIIVFKNGEVVGRLDFDKDEKDADVIIQMITGEKKIVSEKRTYKEIPDERTIDIEHLNYKNVLKDISLHIKKGEVLGIGGLSGQGQEELLLAISGDYKDMKSRIKVNGEEVLLNAPHKAIERGILLIPGDRQKGRFDDAEQYLREPYSSENCIEERTIHSSKKGNTGKSVWNLKRFFLPSRMALNVRYPVFLAVMHRKLLWENWLQVESSLIVLSDPAKGVDVGAKKRICTILYRTLWTRSIFLHCFMPVIMKN